MRVGGQIVSIAVGNPAAGADFTTTIPAGVHELLGIALVLATSATVLNRGVILQLKDGAGNLLGRWGGNWPHPASQTVNYAAPAFGTGQTDPNNNFGSVIIPMPEHLEVLGGWTLSSLTSNLQVGDQLSAIHLALEQFPL